MNRRSLQDWLLMIPLAAIGGATVAMADDAGASLQAIVMDVQGKAKWRPSADGEWRDAKVNDIVDPGTEIRTGLKGRMTLRVGKNATVLVDSGTEFQIPQIVQEGETLRTLATVKSGRVDFKVDKVGFSNDFKVVTPATTLSVRGTGFSLATGPLQGVEVSGVRTNMINAIEVKYVASNATYFMSGASQTSTERQDPVQNAWVSTVGPPAVAGTLADKGQLSQQVAQGQVGNAPTNAQGVQQIASAQSNGQGGNALIIAAQDANASDALRQLAVDVTGNTNAVTPPRREPPDDPEKARLRALLALELANVLDEGPGFLQDTALVSATSAAALDHLYPNGRTDSQGRELPSVFEQAYFRPESAGLPEHQRIREELRELLEQQGLGNELAHALNDFDSAASDPRWLRIDGRPQQVLSGQVQALDAWETSAGNPDRRGHEIFGTPNAEFAFDPAMREDGPRTVAPNAVIWLENAQSWTLADLAGSTQSASAFVDNLASTQRWAQAREDLAVMRRNADFWRIERSGVGPGDLETASMIAIKVNESVQSAWDSVVVARLGGISNEVGGSVGRAHAGLTEGFALVVDSMERRDLMSVQAGIDAYIAAFRAAADSEGSPAAARMKAQFESIALPARDAVNGALDAALDAAQQAHEARSLSQRVFLLAASNQHVRQAAEIAQRCQQATWGEGGIIPNAADMQRLFINANAVGISSGAIRPDLTNSGTQGGRP